MKNRRFASVLALFLSVLTLIGTLPLGVFAFEGRVASAEPNYSQFRGQGGMSADNNGVMIYDDLEAYYKKSQKNVALSTEYKTVVANESDGENVSLTATYPECPYVYADYAIYFDEAIEGTTVKIRYGLSMMDSIYYMDSATGEIVKSDKSPIELTASNKNNNYPDYNAGYGMVYDDEGNLEYTTRHYTKKNLLFYILNHSVSERIGQEDDVSILKDYIDQGYIVVTVDFKSHKDAVSPFIEMALVSLRAMFDSVSDPALKDLDVTIHAYRHYFLPEGCRLERDVWFWDHSLFAVSGTMERYREIWNTKVSYEAEENASRSNPKVYDTLGIGSVDSVEEMISTVTKKDGTPLEYKQSLDIIYPSQPKDDYKAPLYVQESTLEFRGECVLTGYTRWSFTSFALHGYACMTYDHPYWPFKYNREYTFQGAGGNYGLSNSTAHNARAAVRCAKYYADVLGYSDTLVGAAGISKATGGLAVLSVKNNKQLPQEAVTAFGKTYDSSVYEGDVFEGDTVSKSVIQPFMYYDDACTEEVSSDCVVTYNSSGGGMERLFKAWASYEKVPMVLSGGTRDEYGCYSYWDQEVAWFRENATEPFLPIVQLDQGHTYPTGYDTEYDYYRANAMVKFFDVYLKPDEARAPEVLWVTPINGSRDVPLEGKWKVGPYTPYGDEPDSYYYDQQIQIRFVYSVDPASVNSGVTITTEGGKKLEGTWTPSEHNALYTFECDGLAAGTIYNINITSGVKSENGTALAEERTVSFKTEGTYLVEAVADTYVSSAEPDRAFGTAGTLKASGIYTTLVSFEAANVIEAEKVILRADTASDSPLSVNVYALADTLVDSTITYNTLIATDAWANKTLIGEYTIGDGTLSLDLSELADLQLGRYVTLAFESNEEIAEGHKYFNDFETPPLGTAIMNGDIPVVDENGRVTDARYYNKNGQSITPWTINKPSSPYIWARSGTRSEGYLLTDTSISSSRVFRVTTWQGEGQHMKFFNTTTDGYLTANDVGKTFRVTFDIYPTRDMTLSVGFSPAVAGDGSPESPKVPNNDATIIYGSRYVQDLSANQWTTITCDITLTQYLVDMQAGLVTAQLKYPASTDSVRDVYTYFDNLRVEELTPSFEAENGAFSLITTKRGVALNQPITVTFDEAMDLSAVAEDVIVRNEKTGNRVSGEWIAASEDGKSFAFVTKGLEPATTYTVTMADELIRTVVTEGTYAIRPIATSYVSISEPQRHFGLDATPILSSDKLGVVTFSAKTLKTAGIATLYLDVETETNTYLNVYAIADYTPDSTLCYNTVESKLAGAALLESRNAENGKLAIDLSALAGRTLGENVTLILKAGYRFFNDFETPILNGSATPSKAGQVENVPENVSYSDAYIWASAGYTTSGYHINAKGNDSQNLRISTQQYNGHPTGIQHTMFYNTLKVGERMNAGDVGRTYKVSLRLRASVSTDTPLSGQVDPIQLLTGYTTRMTETYNGSTYKAETWLDTPDSRSSVTLTIGDTSWTDCNFMVTVNEVMAGVQGGMLTFQIPGVKYSTTSSGSTVYAKIHTFYDDILVEEIIDEDRAITLPVADFIVMTENTGAVEITAADKPVKDEVVQETPETPDVPDTPIPVGPDASIVSYQVTKGEDGSFDIRLIAGVDSLKYINFGYEITLTTAEGTQMITGETDKVYTSIYGGNIPYSIKKQFGYKYAALATVTGLATDSSSTELTIAAYVTTDAGEKIYGEGATLRYVGTVDSEGYPEFSLVD